MSRDNIAKEYDKERIHIVEIDVPRCIHTHGIGVCTATETGDDKCYNTRATCNDLQNYNDLDRTNIYTYRHTTARSPHPENMNNYAPCVKSVRISPAKVDPRGGVGARSSVSISMSDFPSSDGYGIDPYLSDRTYNPLDQGLYWSKWRARNPNYENYEIRVLSGYIVDDRFDSVNFETRGYVLNSFSLGGKSVSIKAKDPLQLISNKKALAPRPSNGQLTTDITSGATAFTVSPSGVGAEYPSSGLVKIGQEVLSFSRVGDSFTVTRAQRNTTAVAHSQDDTVQLCLEYTGQSFDLVLGDIMQTYAEIPSQYIPGGQWASEVADFLTGNPSALITDPTPVDKLVKELTEQWPSKLFWNDRQQQITLTAIKQPIDPSAVLSDDKNLIGFSQSDKPDMQLSTVFVFYGQINPTKKLDENDNYQVTYARVNLDAIARYGSNNTKTIYSRWISSNLGSIARQTAGLFGRRFGITPRILNFTLEDKDSAVWVGDVRKLRHHQVVDRNGLPQDIVAEVISSEESDFYNYQALEYQYDAEQDGDSVVGIDIIDIPDDAFNLNLRALYEAGFGVPDSSTVAKFIVYAGAVVGSKTAAASIETGSWPSGAQITLQINTGGYVVGAGGDGSSSSTTPGGAGTDAVSLGYNLELINNGVLGGGGGGGGATSDSAFGGTGTAAGGGGAGLNLSTDVGDPLTRGGEFGFSSFTGSGLINQTPAESGSLEVGGAGGSVAWNIAEPVSVFGGKGGDLGQSGTSGDSAGGAAGKAVDLNGNTLTQTVSGDIRGSIS